MRGRDEVRHEAFIPLADFLYKTGVIDLDTFASRKKEEQERSRGHIVHIEASRGVKKSIDKIIAKCVYFQDAVIRIDGIPSPGSLEMSLYDIQGRRVDYRETKVQDSEIRLDYRRPAHLVPGMYILLVEMDSERFMKKMILK